jgi:uncharacterized protein YegL
MQQPKCSLFPAADKGLSGPRRVFWLLLIWLIVGIVIAPGILAQKEQQIPISLGDLIDGFETPAMGGFIEVPGEVEILTFNAEAGERIFLDWGFRDRSLDTLNIRFEGPSSKVYFDALMASPVASGVIQVVRTGLHQLVIGHPESTQIGHYTLRIHRVSEPEFFPMPFAIPTSDAGLGTGAGWIESPGAVDAYTFDSLADQSYILDFLSWDSNLEQINWAMLHEDASGVVGEILSGDLGSFEKRFLNLQKEGAYRLQVGDSVDSGTGSYAFVFQAVPEPDFFELDLGEEVHIAADANGQGNLEMEAASDVFIWSQEQPGRFFFELVGFDSSLQSAQMRLIGPSGEQDVRFSRFFFGGDPGAFTLEEPGDYRLVIGGNLNSGVGRYELRIKPVPEDEEHLLSIGQAIDGTSATGGEGFIPAPGARDVYLFDAQARQRVFFEPLSVSETLGLMTWTLEDPMGNLLFSQCMRCSVPPAMVLKQTGRYRLTVGGFQFAGTGAYSFRVAEIPAPKTYDIEGNQVTVSLDQPQPGAGRLELPGEVDLYRIPLRQGESCHLKLTELSRDLKWKLTDPAGMTVFDSSTDDLSPLDQFFGAERAGDHYLQVFQISANPVNYAFDCQILAACSVLDSETASALPTISFLDYVDGGGVSSPVIQLAGTVGWEGAARQRELVLVMDSSDSLAAYDPEQERMLAVRSLIEALPDEAPMRLALVDFDHEARLLQPLTEDWSEVIEHLSEFDASGGTDLELALNVALDEIIQNGREQATASIILFSDGETSEGNPSAAAQRAQGMGVEIHTVFLGREEVQRARLMETISLATCGNHRKALQASELSDIFRNLTNDVPIDRIQVLSSAQPNISFAGQISGPFWRVEGIPVRAIQDQETELTVLMFTQESSPRIIESKIRLQYGQVSNQAPSMELVSVFESFEDQPAILSLALTDAEDADFDPDLEVSFSRPDWVDPDQGYDLSYQEGRLNLSWHPAADRFGQSLITLSATDSQGARVEQTLRWDLLPVNDPPYLETPEPITVLPGQPILPIGLFGISNGSEYENQQLSFVVSVKDESIMDPPDILYRPGASEGYLVLNHRPGVYGKTLVTITIRDGATTDATYTVQFPVQFQSPENQKPTLQWVRPAANASFLEGESIELEVKAEDADGIVAEILYQANGTQLGAGDPLTGRLAWMPTEPGIYVVEVQAVDDLGSVSEVLSRTLEVKVTPNEPPSLRWVNPSQSLTTMWLGESLKLEVAAEDQDGTIALLEFLVDEEVIASQTSGSHEWVWRPQEAGDHIIQARVQDDDGAQSVSLLRTVKVVPRPAPFSLEITHPNDLDLVCLGEPIQVELALKGSPPSGVVVHLFAGNELVALRSASPYTFDWTPTLPGDLMLQAVAYLDDGSQVSSSAVRLGVSKTCYQAGILVGTNPVADPEWIKSILFEMGVGSVQVATPSESPEAWGEVDLVIAIEDGVTGIQEQTVLDLEYLHHELKLPVFLMGNHLLQSDPAMEEALLHRWRSLIHLEGEGVLSIEGLSELSETGFFQAILAGRFGKVAPFKLSGDMDWAVATEGAEAIVRVEDVDGMVRFPAGGASLEERPRWVTQNFSLISQLGIENDRSRRALFQNAVAWLIGDSVCSNAQFPVQVKAWQDESVAGQWVEQRLDLANFGACELTGGMLWIDYPSAIELDRVDLSMGLGWGLGVDGHSAFVQLGRLAGGGSVKAEVSLWMRGLEPGWHEVRFCSESNNTQEACVSQFWLVSGDSLVPASIRMQMAEDGRLWLRVEGASGVNYQIEVSYDLSHWMPFAEVEGTLTDLPLESLIQAGHPSAYFRLVHP